MIEKIKQLKSVCIDNKLVTDIKCTAEITEKLNEVIEAVNNLTEKPVKTPKESKSCPLTKSGVLTDIFGKEVGVYLFEVSANEKALTFCGENEDLVKLFCCMGAILPLRRWFHNG